MQGIYFPSTGICCTFISGTKQICLFDLYIRMQNRHTYNMGVIGNGSYLAYADTSGNINWMCWPRFDSSYVFGGLLDPEKGGYFFIRPHAEDYGSRQYYIPNTNVLVTEFSAPDGKFRVLDFAPRFYQFERNFKPLMLIRIVEPIEGHPLVHFGCRPIGEYGSAPTETYIGSNHIRYLGLERPLRLTTDFPLTHFLDERPVTLTSSHHCILTYGIPLEGPLRSTARTFFDNTVRYWQDWVNSSSIPHFYQKEFIRSALVLKLHQYQDTGAIIAAGSTSLPETPGEGRNWDYRFCWMRDSYYTLRAINSLGHFKELRRYSNYIQNVTINSGDRYQPLYSITGRTEDTVERILDLQGYLGNKPVRIGNQAVEHIQNDVYGQVLVSLLPLYTDERFVDKDENLVRRNTHHLLERIERTIDEADAGLWEFRNKHQGHCYTFLFHWAGSHAAVKIGKYMGDGELVAKGNKLALRSAENIEKCYDAETGAYRQAIGTKNADASLFQLITMGYLDPKSEKAARHLEVLAEELRYGESLMFRYRHDDDFGTPKNTFLVCAFWYVEALACIGKVSEAMARLEDLVQFGNHLGLFSEDVAPEDKSQWGNFPQTYSHVGLMNAVYMISSRLNKPDYLVY